MDEYLPVIAKSLLFEGVGAQELASLLSCLAPSRRSFARDEFLLAAGDEAAALGLVLSGRCCVVKEDFWGNRNIVTELEPGDIFAESYACVEGARLSVSVLAVEKTTALFLGARKVFAACPSACPFHTRLIRNLVSVLARKNLLMNEKLTHVTQRSTREKLLSYLSSASQRRGASSFEIPFNRQELADYLSVERSAMSAELGRMRDEGLLEFEKNHFELKSGAIEG